MTTITLEQIITFLLEAPMFAELDATELSEIVHIMQVQKVRAGQPVFREGDPGDAWYVIFAGEAEVLKGNEFLPTQRLSVLGEKACFGEMAILDHSARSASVLALGECTVFRFPRRDFEELLTDGNLAAYKLIYQMAKVLCARQRKITQDLTEALAARETDKLRAASMSVVQGQSVSE